MLPELPAQPSEAQLLELLKDIKGVYEAKPAKHVQEEGILSLWSQLFAEFLAITWMLDHEAGIKKSLPVFGGDFNHHMTMHQPSSHVLHFTKHDPDDAGKQCAIAWDDVEMDVDPMQMARPESSDASVGARGGHDSTSADEHSRTVHMSDDVQVVMRRLLSPVNYKSLGKNKPPLQVEHSSFSDYVKSLKIVGLDNT
ncbi:MAG: hypothetical protein FRX49_10593 [Trebouxia sp. A1-2]|nr:MAG: hypothetical protein FRX49_10593 [Trebouxia sp. A1-2]